MVKDNIITEDIDSLIGKLFFSHIDGEWENHALKTSNGDVSQERDLVGMKKIPWYPWSLDDYMSSEKVDLLTMEEEGIYRRLLDRAWHRPDTALPLEIDTLCRLTKNSPADVVKRVVESFFKKTENGYQDS